MPEPLFSAEIAAPAIGRGEHVLISPRVHRSWEKHFPILSGDGEWCTRCMKRAGRAGGAVTAFAGRHPRERALAAGFRAHLAKPVDPEVPCRTVAEVMTAD